MAAERRSFRQSVKELEARLTRAIEIAEKARDDYGQASQRFDLATAEASALRDAYDLIKPRPRVRKAPATKLPKPGELRDRAILGGEPSL